MFRGHAWSGRYAEEEEQVVFSSAETTEDRNHGGVVCEIEWMSKAQGESVQNFRQREREQDTTRLNAVQRGVNFSCA